MLLLYYFLNAVSAKTVEVNVRGTDHPFTFGDNEDLWTAASSFVAKHELTRTEDEECEDVACVVSLLAETALATTNAFLDEGPCPQSYDSSALVRVLVAIPSAAKNVERRNSIRTTWCRRPQPRGTSTRVLFFVGDEKIQDAYEDVYVVKGLVDSPTTVLGKMAASFEAFSRGNYTHYVRVEDDVYLFLDRLAFYFKTTDEETALGRFVEKRTFFDKFEYPRGFAVVVPGRFVQPIDVGDVETGEGRPPNAKGGYIRGTWWNDDEFLGLFLYPLNVSFKEHLPFHDLPGRGPSSSRVSHASVAVNAVQTQHEFDAIHNRERPDALGVRHTWSRHSPSNSDEQNIRVQATVDATTVVLTVVDPALHNVEECRISANSASAELCTNYPSLPPSECENARVALYAVCSAAVQEDRMATPRSVALL